MKAYAKDWKMYQEINAAVQKDEAAKKFG